PATTANSTLSLHDALPIYLASNDINGNADDGDQLVTTHTIGFSMDIPNLQETASDAGGTYYRADDVETLTNALLQAVSNITTRRSEEHTSELQSREKLVCR